MEENRLSRGFIITQIFSGAGMGLLLGIIVGISVSPTVKVVLGALAALLAAFLGLQDSRKPSDKSPIDASKSILTGLRAGSFGFFCVCGILAGIFLRANGALSQSIESQIADWVDAGYEPAYARQLVVYKNMAIKPNWEAVEMNEIQRSTLSTSFSDETSGICDKIRLSTNDNNVEYTLYAYEEAGATLKELAARIKEIKDPETQKSILSAVEEVVCQLETKTQ